MKQKSKFPKVKGYTEEEVLSIIEELSTVYANKYAFSYYSVDDLRQECFIMAVEGLHKYNGEFALRNFLSVHLRNRILNLKRKILKRTEKESTRFDQAKTLIVSPINIDDVSSDTEASLQTEQKSNLYYEEMVNILNNELPPDYRLYLLKLYSGQKISKFHKDRLKTMAQEILTKYGYDLDSW